MKTVTLIIFLILTSSIFGQEISFVVAEEGLIVRETPDLKSKRIGKLLYGTEVQILMETEIELQINDGDKNKNGVWLKIQEVDGTQRGFVFSAYLVGDKLFTLDNPNIGKLKQQIKTGGNTEVIYKYLSNNYKVFSEKYKLEFYEWDKTNLCSFTQEFQNGITYTVFQCKEAGGISVTLTLPKINRKKLMKWIEQIYEVDKMDIGSNIWKENNTKFEPKEINPGCYFEIKEIKNNTLVELYCGC